MSCRCETMFWFWFDGIAPRSYIENKFIFCPFCGEELDKKKLSEKPKNLADYK